MSFIAVGTATGSRNQLPVKQSTNAVFYSSGYNNRIEKPVISETVANDVFYSSGYSNRIEKPVTSETVDKRCLL